MSARTDEQSVGYRRPPKRTQWKKGQSGNPKRKYSPRDDSTISMIDRLLMKPIEIVMNGQKLKVPALAAITLQLWTNELAGNRKAMRIGLRYKQFANRHAKRGVEIVFVENEYTRAFSETLAKSDSGNG